MGRHKGYYHTIETKQLFSMQRKGKHPSEESRKKNSESNKLWIRTPEYGRKISEKAKQRPLPTGFTFKGRHHAKEAISKIKKNGGRPRKECPYATKEELYQLYWIDNLSMAEIEGRFGKSCCVGYWFKRYDIPRRSRKEANQLSSKKIERNMKISDARKGKPISEKCRIGASLRASNPNSPFQIAAGQVRSMLLANKRPNKFENNLYNLINIVCPNEYKYVGDGSIIIGGLNPDFININGKKKLIEAFGDYWHQGQNPKDRISKYAEFGFDCLVIWEHELEQKSKEELVEAIKNFNQRGH